MTITLIVRSIFLTLRTFYKKKKSKEDDYEGTNDDDEKGDFVREVRETKNMDYPM